MKNIIIKIFNLPQFLKYGFARKNPLKRWDAKNDLDLELYSKLFAYENLHYGFFKKPTTDYKKLAFADIATAMHDYNDFLLKKLKPYQVVLDVGCGNGTLLNLLKKNKKKAQGVTPNLEQYHHIQKNFPSLDVICSGFEEVIFEEIKNYLKLDVVLMAESFQYLPLEKTIQKMADWLQKKPHLTWVIFDYFRISDQTQNPSGHTYRDFKSLLKRYSLTVKEEKDCTDNVLPTLGYVYFLVTTFTAPLLTHYKKNLAFTHPLMHYLFSDTLGEQVDKINFEVVNPQKFKKEKKYLFLKIKKK